MKSVKYFDVLCNLVICIYLVFFFCILSGGKHITRAYNRTGGGAQ